MFTGHFYGYPTNIYWLLIVVNKRSLIVIAPLWMAIYSGINRGMLNEDRTHLRVYETSFLRSVSQQAVHNCVRLWNNLEVKTSENLIWI